MSNNENELTAKLKEIEARANEYDPISEGYRDRTFLLALVGSLRSQNDMMLDVEKHAQQVVARYYPNWKNQPDTECERLLMKSLAERDKLAIQNDECKCENGSGVSCKRCLALEYT